jgi:hypothetical protein
MPDLELTYREAYRGESRRGRTENHRRGAHIASSRRVVQHEVGVQQCHVETRMLDVQDVASRLVERHIRIAGGRQPCDLGLPQQQKDAGDAEKQHRDT